VASDSSVSCSKRVVAGACITQHSLVAASGALH
jgi:hypothetical protein